MRVWLKLTAAVTFLVAWPVIPLVSLNEMAHSSAWWDAVALGPASLALFFLLGIPWMLARRLRLRLRQVISDSPGSPSIPINAQAGSRCVLSLGKQGVSVVPHVGEPRTTPWNEVARVDMIKDRARPGHHIEVVLMHQSERITFVPLGSSAVHPMRKSEIVKIFSPWENAAIEASARNPNSP